ncbi:hypothetical protein [uncultured Methanoregula sp.]|uniref:hypothetical protein n=1 Tax=uncultured Methanoregula sp. TaxID=1005933 RepID=UPI002AAB8DA1|nr:hypothetical protein [uncultured Methanoregula sp.]
MNAALIESLRKKTLVIYSAGCGNGKSEIAASLALSTARKGLRTWILDANTFTPAQDFIFGFPHRNPTFSDFLVDPSIAEMPVYPLRMARQNPHPASLFLTPSERNDPAIRFTLQETLNSESDIYSRIPEAVYAAMVRHKIDLLLIDTHPGFEKINEVWMGMTGFLLVTSRINPVDLESLTSLLQDPSVQDIRQKLVVFTNVQIDRSRKVSPDMENDAIIGQVKTLQKKLEQEPKGKNGTAPLAFRTGNTIIHEDAFLYSEKLALFQQAAMRQEMFIDKEPEDCFSENIRTLADKVMDIISGMQ